MTYIKVMTPRGRLSLEQRRLLARTLTDAVLVPEVGKLAPQARGGYQIHFFELDLDMMANGGELLSDVARDAMMIDIAAMDCAWPRDVRADVIRRVLAAMAEACGVEKPSARWWVNFRVIEEGSWGSRGDVLSFLELLDLDASAFTPERAAAIRRELGAKP